LPMQGKRLLDGTRCGGARRRSMPFHADTRSPHVATVRDGFGQGRPIWLIKGKGEPQELHVNRINVSNGGAVTAKREK
jgi:hypothetical protein